MKPGIISRACLVMLLLVIAGYAFTTSSVPISALEDNGDNDLSSVNASDDSRAQIKNIKKDSPHWLDASFTNTISLRADVTSAAVSIEHYEGHPQVSMLVQWWNGTWVTTSCGAYYNGPEAANESTDTCDLSAYIDTVTEANNVTLRFYFTSTSNAKKSAYMDSLNLTVSYVIDSTPPSVVINSPAGPAAVSGNVTISASVTDANLDSSGVHYRWENATKNGTWTRMSNTSATVFSAVLDTTALNDGGYTIRVKATDVKGNTNSTETVRITVDNTVPPLLSPETKCNDWRDNDNDGSIDCADPDCKSSPSCAPPFPLAPVHAQGFSGASSAQVFDDDPCSRCAPGEVCSLVDGEMKCVAEPAVVEEKQEGTAPAAEAASLTGLVSGRFFNSVVLSGVMLFVMIGYLFLARAPRYPIQGKRFLK